MSDETDNIIQHPLGTVVMNGGNPLDNCPTDWDKAREWQNEANKDKYEWEEPTWEWDCGFKLDFDGPLIRVVSRFYPPKTHYGPQWDGNVRIYSMFSKSFEDTLAEKSFECETLDELRRQVEEWVNSYAKKVVAAVKASN